MIAIIGAGNVGQALAFGFLQKGYAVRFGVPDSARHAGLPEKLAAEAKASSASVFVGTVEEALRDADAAILATPYSGALQVARDIKDWGRRVLIDATNPIAPALAGLLVGTVSSGAEEIAKLAHNARVVKAFNTTGFENMKNPRYPTGGLFMPVAGDDDDARNKTIALAAALGFDAVDLGKLAAARYLEPMAMVWIEMALRLGHGRHFGFVRDLGAPPVPQEK